MKTNHTHSSYRWIMMALCVLALLGQTFTWLVPAPLLGIIIDDLGVGIGEAGALLTVITLVTGTFAFAGSFFIDKLGAKTVMVIGLGLFGLGGIASVYTETYSEIFAARFLVGLGFGICLPIVGVTVSSWFPAKEQPFMNAIVVITSYVGMVLAYTITLPILELTGSWQKTLATIGCYVVLVALLWLVLARKLPAPANSATDQTSPIPLAPPQVIESGLKQAAKRKEIWLLMLMLFGVMWTFNTFTTYLSIYFQEIRGLDTATASAITGVLPLAGVIGGLLCGFGTGALGLRKPFTWPLFVLMFLGAIGSVIIPSGVLLYISVGLIGFGAAGFSPIFFQVPMELDDITPAMVGGSLAIIIGCSYIASYFSPLLFGLLSPHIGMASTLLVFGCSLLISLIAGVSISETGPRKRIKTPPTAIPNTSY
ncbi:MAG: MFS transporter [Porticoccaceae bacterium]